MRRSSRGPSISATIWLRIKAPTLAIAGPDDPATPPAMLEEIAAGVPDARLRVVRRAAHLANAEKSDIVTLALIEHLEQS